MGMSAVGMFDNGELGINDSQPLQILPGYLHHYFIGRLFAGLKTKDSMQASLGLAGSKLLLADKILGHDLIIMVPDAFRDQDLGTWFYTDIPASMVEGFSGNRLADHVLSFFSSSSIPVRYRSKSSIAERRPSW